MQSNNKEWQKAMQGKNCDFIDFFQFYFICELCFLAVLLLLLLMHVKLLLSTKHLQLGCEVMRQHGLGSFCTSWLAACLFSVRHFVVVVFVKQQREHLGLYLSSQKVPDIDDWTLWVTPGMLGRYFGGKKLNKSTNTCLCKYITAHTTTTGIIFALSLFVK